MKPSWLVPRDGGWMDRDGAVLASARAMAHPPEQVPLEPCSARIGNFPASSLAVTECGHAVILLYTCQQHSGKVLDA